MRFVFQYKILIRKLLLQTTHKMARGSVIWLTALFLGSSLGQPLPGPQWEPPCPCSLPSPPGLPNPFPEVIDIGPCDPYMDSVNYLYGQAPPGELVVRPGQIRFPPLPPIIVRPGRINPPKPPPILIRPNPVQPPTPCPITVTPPPVKPPTPPPFWVQVPPIQPPTPPPIVVRPEPVPVPRPPPMKVQPGPVPVPPPCPLVVRPPKILVPSPPIICFHPNPPTNFRLLGRAVVVPLERPFGPHSPCGQCHQEWNDGSDFPNLLSSVDVHVDDVIETDLPNLL